ncbi:hypothetical protein AYO49_04665 [Verrucomicrobiaceae bacterium SCGC AG-212-N21]|nr:hypothetical protein AYO49_04665 [Verrucomicrobiaceae bacterium SCGC AG-212-N21]
MSDLEIEDIKHLLEDTKTILQDLDASEARLHSAPASSSEDDGGLVLASNTPTAGAEADGGLKLASRQISAQQKTIKSFQDASQVKRDEMLASDAGLRLFSVIFAEYRPGPAFQKDHALRAGTLDKRITPGGATWESKVNRNSIAGWSRHAVRLDNAQGSHRGSGTITKDGQILTASHVIGYPGYVFGNPPSSTATGLAGFNRTASGTALDVAIQSYQLGSPLDYAWIKTTSTWPQALAGTEFAINNGLPMQSTELTKDQLKGRLVAVIGHPAEPGASDAEKAKLVFNDAPYSLKRFMPGMIHPTEPLREEGGLVFIRHDCSTLGGASGGCLIDLETGVILGVHVSGKSPDGNIDRNGAVPAWLIKAWNGPV